MYKGDPTQGQAELRNAELVCRFQAGRELWLSALHEHRTARSLLLRPAPFAELVADGPVSTALSGMQIVDGELRASWSDPQVQLVVRLDGPTLRWRLDFARTSGPLRVRFPFLRQLWPDPESSLPPTVRDARAFCDANGRLIVRHADWPLPTSWLSPDGRALTLLGGPPTLSVPAFSNEWAIPELPAAETTAVTTEWEAELHMHDGGWPAAFELFRRRVRAGFDLRQYERPDQHWYRDQLVHHFTFLYGREILNLETGELEIDRFLDDGEHDFGGYDGMLIWGVYPRIGVDERSQWDFHDDFPGGRRGLRTMARRARERGVRFFIPYKPWDRAAELRDAAPRAPDHEELAQLVADVEADGVFLDTMSAVSTEFRDALDRARPGIVFCSEGRAKGAAFEVITGSWDQSLYQGVGEGNWSAENEWMPGLDLWRFIFPEHRLFVINRHATAQDRVRFIQRGFFGGTGWVVWQDVFGLVLPYTPAEAALLKRCRTILREHRQALWSTAPTPLIATSHPQVYCNEFPGASKRLWTLYNASDSVVEVGFPQLVPRSGYHFVDVWNNRAVTLDRHGLPNLMLDPEAVGALAELPKLLQLQSDAAPVMVGEPMPAMVLELLHAGAVHSVTPDSHVADLRALHAHSHPAVLRLLMDGELLDQLVVSPAAEGAEQ